MNRVLSGGALLAVPGAAGRWTSTMLKEAGKWLFLAWSWVETDE